VNLHFHAHAVASGSFHRRSSRSCAWRLMMEVLSNIYSHPGRAGGSPADARLETIADGRTGSRIYQTGAHIGLERL
jgi:hypothetical protein